MSLVLKGKALEMASLAIFFERERSISCCLFGLTTKEEPFLGMGLEIMVLRLGGGGK